MVSNFTSTVVLLVLMLVAGHVKVIFGVEENESASAGHYPDYDGTHSKRYGFSACKYEFMRARDVYLDNR